MVRLVFSDDPKQLMAAYPGKVFGVIGPFDNHHDKAELREALRNALMEHNKKAHGGRLSLHERC
jgi:hypothetical protein